MFNAKSSYISCTMSTFYGTEIEIWAGFGPVGSTEKKNWADYEQLFRAFLKFLKKYCSVHRTKKLHRVEVRKPKKTMFEILLWTKIGYRNISNCVLLYSYRLGLTQSFTEEKKGLDFSPRSGEATSGEK